MNHKRSKVVPKDGQDRTHKCSTYVQSKEPAKVEPVRGKPAGFDALRSKKLDLKTG